MVFLEEILWYLELKESLELMMVDGGPNLVVQIFVSVIKYLFY